MLGSAMSNYWMTWGPGALLATIGVLALVWKGLRTLVKVTDALPTLYDINAEFRPNGGGSIKDRIEVLHDGQVKVMRRIGEQDKRMDKHEAALERIEDKLGP